MTTTLQRNSVSNSAVNPIVQRAITQRPQPAPPVYAFLAVSGDFSAGINELNKPSLYLHQLGLELAQRSGQVDIFVRREHPHQPEIEEHRSGCRTIRLTAGPVVAMPPTQVVAHLPALVAAWLAFRQHSQRNYVLLQTADWLSGWVGLQLKHQLGLPLVHTSSAINTLKELLRESVKVLPMPHSVERQCLEQADCVVASTPQEVADLRQMIAIGGQSQVVPWGINTEYLGTLSRSAARLRLVISLESRVILYVGGFAPDQGIATLINACASLPRSFQLYLVSRSEDDIDLEEKRQIRALVKRLNLEECVVFTGVVTRSQLSAYYAAANVCVVPSYYEASRSVLLEAMAAGTPVIASAIATAVDELRYIVRHGQTGLLVPPFNPNALVTALWDALTNPSRWQTYGLTGKHWVKLRFSYAAVAKQMQDCYRSLILAGMYQPAPHPNPRAADETRRHS